MRFQRTLLPLFLWALIALPGVLFANPDFSAHLEKMGPDVALPPAVARMVREEQVLHNKRLWHEGAFRSNISPEYVPERQPKFPLSYYLVPEEAASFLESKSLSERIRSQLSHTASDGKRYYRLFVHPETYEHYSFLEGRFKFVGPEKTEFLATPTSSYRSLVVWQKSGETPFIAKVSLDKTVIGSIDRLVSRNEVERSLANQLAFDRYGREMTEGHGLKIMPETAGILLNDGQPGAPEKVGGMIVREIPDEVLSGKLRHVSFSTLMSPEARGPPMIMEVIKRSGLSSADFIEKYLVDDYMNMFEEISLKAGLNTEPHAQNLMFELDANSKPTGNFVIRDFGGIWPDIVQMDKNNGPVAAYTEARGMKKFKLDGGRVNSLNSYIKFYRRQVFDMLVGEITKHDKNFTHGQAKTLRKKLDNKFRDAIKRQFGLALPSILDTNRIEELLEIVRRETKFTGGPGYKKIESTAARKWRDVRMKEKEWVQLLPDKDGSPVGFFATKNTLYQVQDGRVTGFSVFAQESAPDFLRVPRPNRVRMRPPADSCSGHFERMVR